jgi:hypothetical protein
MTNIHPSLSEDHPWARKKPCKPHRDEDDIRLFWLEFTNPDDGAFMGVAVVPATKDAFIEAVQVAHHYKCNPPGSQVARIEVKDLERLPRSFLVRLLNEADVDAAQAILRRAKLT